MYCDKKQVSGCLGMDRREELKKQKRKLGDSRYVHYLDCGDSLMVPHICEYMLNLTNFAFYIWALCY